MSEITTKTHDAEDAVRTCAGYGTFAEEEAGPVTWEDLTRMEPALIDLHKRIHKAVGGRKLTFEESLHLWYGRAGQPGFKHEMNQLVGFWATRDIPALKTAEAHGTAYQKLFFETIEQINL